MPSYPDPNTDRHALEAWQAEQWDEMAAMVETLPDALLTVGWRHRSTSLLIRSSIQVECHRAYFEAGIEQLAAWLDIKAVWGESA